MGKLQESEETHCRKGEPSLAQRMRMRNNPTVDQLRFRRATIEDYNDWFIQYVRTRSVSINIREFDPSLPECITEGMVARLVEELNLDIDLSAESWLEKRGNVVVATQSHLVLQPAYGASSYSLILPVGTSMETLGLEKQEGNADPNFGHVTVYETATGIVHNSDSRVPCPSEMVLDQTLKLLS